MIPLTSATVLELWEAGLGRSPAGRASLLLAAAGESELDDWPVGRRDRVLLEHFCGPDSVLDGLADCPSCGSVLDVAVDTRAVLGDSRPERVSLDVDGHHVVARAATVGDLRSLRSDGSPGELRTALLERCVVRATRAGVRVAPADLPAAVVDRVEDELDRLDPTADIVVVLDCADCGARWSESLDPVRFAWSTVESTARRLATDVHALARAYGWSEHDILALSPFRRHLYLSAVQG